MFKKCFLSLFLCFLAACSNSQNDYLSPLENSSSQQNEIIEKKDTTESIDGMTFIEGSNDTIILGTNQVGAKNDETPEMKVILDYDYFLGNSEITCQEFKSVMAKSEIIG